MSAALQNNTKDAAGNVVSKTDLAKAKVAGACADTLVRH